MWWSVRVAVLIMLSVGLASCAATPKVMRYYPEMQGTTPEASWPGPESVPRIEYAGQLIGEQNFVSEEADRGRGERFWRWLVGLGRGERRTDQLVRPQTGIVDSLGRILVTDSGQPSVFVFDEAAATYAIWREAGRGLDFVSPVGIAEQPSGNFLVVDADLRSVFILSAEGDPVGRFDDGTLLRPTGLDIDAATGNVYIADTEASVIKEYSATGAFIRAIGVPGDNAGELNSPMHVRLADGKLFVADALNGSVQIYTVETGERIGQIGRRGLYVGNMVRPKGIAVDRDGNVYIVESYYDHVLIYNQDGEFLLPVGGTGNEVGRFFLPAGAWSDGNDRIFVADMFNARVMIFRYVGAGA